jgi:hypothetical protein
VLYVFVFCFIVFCNPCSSMYHQKRSSWTTP